jgi:hypothetical protein
VYYGFKYTGNICQLISEEVSLLFSIATAGGRSPVLHYHFLRADLLPESKILMLKLN